MHRLSALTDLVAHPSVGHAVELALVVVVLGLGIRLLSRMEMTKLVVAGIVLEVFSGNWKYIPLPLPLDRACLALSLVVVVLRGAGAAGGRKIVFQPIHFLLLGVAVYVFLNGLWAGTVLHSYGLYAWLDRLGAVPFLLFTLAPTFFGTERQRHVLLVGMVGVGLYLGVEGLAEGLGVHALQLPRYISDPSIGITADRTRGPFLASDAMGLALFDCCVFSAIALSRWRRPAARLICWSVMALGSIDIFFTLTRAIWIGAALGVGAAMLLHPRLRRLLPVALVGGTIAVVVLLAAVPGLSDKVSGRVGLKSSIWDRYNTNDAAVRALGANPVFGIGWQMFESEGTLYLREAQSYPLTGEGLEVHNVFLSHFVELGIVGGAFWTLALSTAVGGSVLRRGPPELWVWRIGLLSMFVVFLVAANFAPLSYAFPNLLIWLTAGIVATGRTSEERDQAVAAVDGPELSGARR